MPGLKPACAKERKKKKEWERGGKRTVSVFQLCMFLPIAHKINMTTLPSYYIIFKNKFWHTIFFQSFDEFFFNFFSPSISHPIVNEEWGSDVGFVLECLISYRKRKGKKLSHLLCLFFTSLLHRVSGSTLNCGFLKFLWCGFQQSKIFKMLFLKAIQ